MKANVKKVDRTKLLVRGVVLDFNGLNEHDLKKWEQIGNKVAEKYPDSMDLVSILDSSGENGENIIKKYAEGTKAYCELFTGVFGKESAQQLLGDKPYWGLCNEIYYEIVEAIQKQGQSFGDNLGAKFEKFAPTGIKGDPSKEG